MLMEVALSVTVNESSPLVQKKNLSSKSLNNGVKTYFRLPFISTPSSGHVIDISTGMKKAAVCVY